MTKTFEKLTDSEVLKVASYLKKIYASDAESFNPFQAKRTYPYDMPDYPLAITQLYYFNDNGDVYDMENMNEGRWITTNIPPVKSTSSNTYEEQIERLQKYEAEFGKIEW